MIGLEVHLGHVARDVDQVVARAAVAVQVAGEDVAGVADRAALPEDGHGRRAELEEALACTDADAKKRWPGDADRVAEARVVRIARVLVVVPGAERDRAGIDGVLRLAVAVGGLEPEAVASAAFRREREVPRRADVLVLQHDARSATFWLIRVAMPVDSRSSAAACRRRRRPTAAAGRLALM